VSSAADSETIPGMGPLAEGLEVTSHQRVIDSGPRPVTVGGLPLVPDCVGTLVVAEGDRGRGPIIVVCDVCGHSRGMARREPDAQRPLAAVGAWTDTADEGRVGPDGYAAF